MQVVAEAGMPHRAALCSLSPGPRSHGCTASELASITSSQAPEGKRVWCHQGPDSRKHRVAPKAGPTLTALGNNTRKETREKEPRLSCGGTKELIESRLAVVFLICNSFLSDSLPGLHPSAVLQSWEEERSSSRTLTVVV